MPSFCRLPPSPQEYNRGTHRDPRWGLREWDNESSIIGYSYIYVLRLVDGKEITPVNENQIRQECEVIRSKGLKNIAVVGVFSPLAGPGTQEEYVEGIIKATLGDKVNVVCSKNGDYCFTLPCECPDVIFSGSYRPIGTRECSHLECFHSHFCSEYRQVISTSPETVRPPLPPVLDSGTVFQLQAIQHISLTISSAWRGVDFRPAGSRYADSYLLEWSNELYAWSLVPCRTTFT